MTTRWMVLSSKRSFAVLVHEDEDSYTPRWLEECNGRIYFRMSLFADDGRPRCKRCLAAEKRALLTKEAT